MMASHDVGDKMEKHWIRCPGTGKMKKFLFAAKLFFITGILFITLWHSKNMYHHLIGTTLIASSMDSMRHQTSTRMSSKVSLEHANYYSSESASDQPNFTAVILLSYMRSGSSLTGDILQQPEDSFYVFEPLRAVEWLDKFRGPVSFINGTVLDHGSFDIHTVYLDTLIRWFKCDIANIYIGSLLDTGFPKFGKHRKYYSQCDNRYRHKNSTFYRDFVTNKDKERERNVLKVCIKNLQDVCIRSKFRIIKTIRANMSLAADVLGRLKGSKIIHLVRDPRATLNSRFRWRTTCPTGLTSCAKEYCQIVRGDTMTRNKLASLSPRRFLSIKYEDIVLKPIETANSMYLFLGMNFTSELAHYVYNITLGTDKSGCVVCLQSWQLGKSASSPEKHVNGWKRTLQINYINMIEGFCSEVMEYYGYKPYGDKVKTNKSIRK